MFEKRLVNSPTEEFYDSLAFDIDPSVSQNWIQRKECLLKKPDANLTPYSDVMVMNFKWRRGAAWTSECFRASASANLSTWTKTVPST